MKVLIVNTHDFLGGAARAARRLHHALLAKGIESKMLVQHKSDNDHTIYGPHTKLSKALALVLPTLDSLSVRFNKNRSISFFSTAWVGGIAKQINTLNPDIVHLHWICGGMMRIEEIKKIEAPIVWSLHDMWPFTGGCHYDGGCGKYNDTCGNCPMLGSDRERDLSRKIYERKKRTYSQVENMTILGLSHWLTDCARQSSLFANKLIVNLPNPIDTARFSPVKKSIARSILNLPIDKKIILFSAISAASNSRKGYKELIGALRLMLGEKALELVILGGSSPQGAPDLGFKMHHFGLVHDDVTLQLLYSAADVVIVPSIEENLSNTIMESLSCGTPVVGFNIGGNNDMIEHQQNGYLARPYEPDSLAEGIGWVLDSDNPRVIAENARNKVLSCFDSHLVSQQYLELYGGILKRS